MARKARKIHLVRYVAKNMSVVIGIVLIWRGIWYGLDELDILFLDGNHMPLAIAGIVVGLLILYLPDKDLKELEKL